MIIKPLEHKFEWEWMYARTGVILCGDMTGLVAVHDNDIVAVCVADSFGPDQCSVHFAIDNPMVLRHGFLEAIAKLLFIGLGRARIFGMVPADNAKALKLDKHIGMREVARIPNGFKTGVDYIIMCMERGECRWLPEDLREVA